MRKFKKAITNWRIILLIIALVLAIVAINPAPGMDGVAVRNVEQNSSAYEAGMKSPESQVPPRSREVIESINGQEIEGIEEYYELTSNLEINQTVSIKTNEDLYVLQTREEVNITKTGNNITKTVTEEVFNETQNKTINVTRNVTEPEIIKNPTGEAEDLGLTVYDAPTSNIRKGLDLTGGTRVILQPQKKLEPDKMELLVENIKQRLNVFGLGDVVVRSSSDLSGNEYIIVEIAGATEDAISDVVSRQGRFQAKIGEETVFTGGDDITYVCRSADCSGIDPQRGCNRAQNGNRWSCGFFFQINLAPEAAERQANITKDLSVNSSPSGQQGYLSKSLRLFLDGEQVDSLQIASSLKGRASTEISITGSGNGTSKQQAEENTLEQMKELQTVLITGSLPAKLEIERVDTISPTLGGQFLQNAMLIGILAIAAVALTVFIAYRKFVISLPMIVAMASEAILILGVASLIGWSLDLAAIAGIIIAIGTGVDDQVIIADETLHRQKKSKGGWKERIKRAFFIIFAAYFTLVVAMIPLWFAGAGMLRGFAITTILGVSVGVFITRPAYAKLVEIFSED